LGRLGRHADHYDHNGRLRQPTSTHFHKKGVGVVSARAAAGRAALSFGAHASRAHPTGLAALLGLGVGLQLGAQARDLGVQGGVFGLFALQEARGDAGLGVDALRREQVEIGAFVAAVAEVLNIDPAAVEEGCRQ
jgi:hypothetical protein